MANKTSFLSAFIELLRTYPDLQPFLFNICRRFRKKGVLARVMKLGQNLSSGELEALRAVFGMQGLTISRSGEVRISFDRFFKGMDSGVVEEWIDGLHLCLGLTRGDEVRQKYLEQRKAEIMFERLRLAFPELAPVFQYLAQRGSAGRAVSRGHENLQDIYFRAAEIVRFLRGNKEIITFSDLGARFCNDSKALRDTELSGLVESWLLMLENGDGLAFDAEQTVWGRHHIVRDRLSVVATVFGPLIYEKNSQTYDWIYKLWQVGEPATLSWANIAGIDQMYAAGDVRAGDVITCENETPFGRMVRERQPGIILYSSGFPNEAVISLYRLMAPGAGSCRHWGDSDLAGLQIAAILHAVHPLKLWRCDFDTLAKHQNCTIALSEEQRNRIENFLAKHPDFLFARELSFTLANGWLEQESWGQT